MTPEANSAIDQIQNNNPDHYAQMFGFAKEWVKSRFSNFSSEDLKSDYYATHPKPKDDRLWGAVMRELRKSGLIIFRGYQTYKAPSGHGRPSTVWISKAYSDVQSANASGSRSISNNNQYSLL